MNIAQVSPSFTAMQLATFMGIVFFIFALVIAARKVFGQDPPLHKEYASRTDAEFLKGEINKVDGERRTSVANLHTKIDTQLAALRAELTGKIEKLEGRIDAVPERTIKLLRETKDLI